MIAYAALRPAIRRVLIYRLGSLGDMVVALPSFHLIARAFPNAERRLLTNIPVHAKAPAAAAILGESGLVHAYMSYPVGMRNLRDIFSIRSRIRAFRPEVLVYLAALRGEESLRRDRLFFRLCGVREIIGLPGRGERLERRRLPDSAEFERESVRLARSIGVLGELDLNDAPSWDMRLSHAEKSKASAAIAGFRGPVLAVSVGTKVQCKDWGEANWTALLTRLASVRKQWKLVLIGAAEEASLSDRAAAAWAGRAINLCGSLNPRESAALIAQADLFLGHDSGPMHLAAAAGVPCVAIFAARNLPRVWFPYGDHHTVLYHRTDCCGCELETCITEKKKCILSITVDEVLKATLPHMDATAWHGERTSESPGVEHWIAPPPNRQS